MELSRKTLDVINPLPMWVPSDVRNQWQMGLLAAACLCSMALSACGRVTRSDNASTTHKTPTKTVLAPIRNPDNASGKWTSQALDGSEALIGIQFVDSDHGWVASSVGSLYRTSDRGLIWSKVRVPMPAGASLTSFFFDTPSSGWISIHKLSSDVFDAEGNESWISRTRDAGETWSLQYRGRGAQVDEIRFANDGEGWAVGIRYVSGPPLEGFPLVMHTSDLGEHWTDLSERLNWVSPDDGVTDLHIPKRSEAMLTTGRGKVIKTDDAGQSWREVAAIEGEPTQTYFGRFQKTPEGHLWLLGGTDSLEGMWGVLAKREPDASWTRYTTEAYFRDAVFLSEKEIVVCGHIRSSAGSAPTEGHREGAILRSLNGGSSWTIVYHSPKVPSINGLVVQMNSNTVWAVGENGFILRLEFSANAENLK